MIGCGSPWPASSAVAAHQPQALAQGSSGSREEPPFDAQPPDEADGESNVARDGRLVAGWAELDEPVEPAPSRRQYEFIRYLLYILTDLVVLSLFVEYWDAVVIDSFTISLLTAILLQVLLKVTLVIEHRIAVYFKARPGRWSWLLRVIAAWLVLFGSKFVILELVDIVFGEQVEFGGVVPFIIVVVTMLLAEAIVERVYRALR